MLNLAFGLALDDLYTSDGLQKVDTAFLGSLAEADPALHGQLLDGRNDPGGLQELDYSNLIIALAPHLDGLLASLFGIEAEVADETARHTELAELFDCRRRFVQIGAARAHKAEEAEAFDGPALRAHLTEMFGGSFDQTTFAHHAMAWRADKKANAESFDIATRYAAWAALTEAGKAYHKDDVVFRLFGRPDPFELVASKTVLENGVPMLQNPDDDYYQRDNFELTDAGADLINALYEANYCTICHDRARDYCTRGLPEEENGEPVGDQYAVNALGVRLVGCPLEVKISEMHRAMIDGYAIGALAVITADNPLVAATGHRICNDCVLSCIFQKQDPVNVPQAETRILKDVLALPWGFEIYSLLTRWNPMNLERPYPKPATGYKVLVVGMGPAAFGLAHQLLNEGHTVVGVDGLKIEPLAPELSGVGEGGERVPFEPIRDIQDLYESLDDRVMAGFGGVAEYGITVRWDKNFLKVVRLLIERRRQFGLFGGVRFGSVLTKESAFEMGFDHIALCAGAGKPTYLLIPNGLARGVRQASDFLMALQLTGAAKMGSIANLQIRLPVVVIGGGLTAIDTATEARAYYIRQVEKFLGRYEALVAANGAAAVEAGWNDEQAAIADEYLSHARAIRDERQAAAGEGRDPRFIELLDQWGGIIIAYRRRLTASPSYTLNSDEVVKAFEQGVKFAELLAPSAVEVDEYGAAKAIRLARQEIGDDGRSRPTGEEISLPARSILVAIGTQPNTTLAREHPGFTEMDGKYYQALDEDGAAVKPELIAKPKNVHVLTNIDADGRGMSFFGDLHPAYDGNVVKAMTSAKLGYPVIGRILAQRQPSAVKPGDFLSRLNGELRPVVERISLLVPGIYEVVVRAPMAARGYRAGQFFRLQNYEANAIRANGTTLAMEGVALTGAWVDRQEGLVALVAMEMGGSTELIKYLQAGEPVVMMGPTGAPTEIPGDETVLLAGGGVGNAVLLAVNQALRDAGARVLYFAAYKGTGDRFHIDAIERDSDIVVWCCDEAPGFEPRRPKDKAFVGNIVEAMKAYGNGELGQLDIPLSEVDRIVAVGSPPMMKAVHEARGGVLKDLLRPDHIAIASINSPMQCMMKEICAQCLQPNKNPETGEDEVVFSCFNQDQAMDAVDFAALQQRLAQNGVQEKLTAQWIEFSLQEREAAATG
ncbi:MAG: FAD-dependent oxidoreductase [Rhodospirillales bacterium]|jgi:NADPH-dependent glutamate synthase beta subunit-like oxidoreductase/NAD(P)H-flavin reductase|nr:pyridine nucleotide-disulfide oxidoreductase [Rhodospirillaceae bacterium]MDP6430541.1 FAD-dependent oxidoreductase [Rhodospirillales bacterium]MDP6643562.1 FAD-dependent oxidoreductase [Rhodospirillales bacterium]